MKNLITIFVMLIVVGCGKSKIFTKEDVGSYEGKIGVDAYKLVFFEDDSHPLILDDGGDGLVEVYVNSYQLHGSELGEVSTWTIVGKEVYIDSQVFRIESNGDLTVIAEIKDEKLIDGKIKRNSRGVMDGKREELSKEDQSTLEKAK